jgi:hypothetical protein
MSARVITILIAVLSAVATVLSVLTDSASLFHLSVEQGLFVGAIGSGIYALVRALQKVKAGTPVRALILATENQAAVLMGLLAIATAAKGVVSPAHSTIVISIVTVLTVIARNLHISGVDPKNPGPPIGGPPKAFVGLLFLLVASLASPVWAQTPVPVPAPTPISAPALDCGPLGVAVNSLGICIVPSTAGGQVFNLKTGSVSNLGILVGLAAIHHDNLNLGGGIYCGANLALNAPSGGMCAVLFTIKNYGAAGGGFLTFHDPIAEKYVFQGLVLYAGTLHFGSAPSLLTTRREQEAVREDTRELTSYVQGLGDGVAACTEAK